MVKDQNELWVKRLDNLFKKKEQSETEAFLNVVSMVIYNNVNSNEISKLYAATDLNTFLKLINIFENQTVTFPSKKEIRDAIELALFYYYKNVLGVTDYSQLKQFGIIEEKDFSSISIGKRVSKLNKEIIEKLKNLGEEL